MEKENTERLAQLEAKLEAVHVSVEKTRKYLLIIMWSSLAMMVAPLLIAAVIVPMILASFTSSLGL